MSRNRQKLPLRLAGSLVAVAAAAAPLAVSSPASAQNRCYRVINLGPIGFHPDGAGALFGINNNDQGVFTAEVNNKKHAIALPANRRLRPHGRLCRSARSGQLGSDH